jgi:hypothetical protein
MENQGGLWDDAVIVHTYTDEQAVEDGYLVGLGGGHRATRALWDYLEGLGLENPPDRVLIDLFAFIKSPPLGILRALVTANETEARKVYEENIGGGIWTTELLGRTVWLIPNEVGGLTAMFPEDY